MVLTYKNLIYLLNLQMYMINLIIIYDVVNIFSAKSYESLRKLRVGVNRYARVNWSTTTIHIYLIKNIIEIV